MYSSILEPEDPLSHPGPPLVPATKTTSTVAYLYSVTTEC